MLMLHIIAAQHNGIRHSGINAQQKDINPLRILERFKERAVGIHQRIHLFHQIFFSAEQTHISDLIQRIPRRNHYNQKQDKPKDKHLAE